MAFVGCAFENDGVTPAGVGKTTDETPEEGTVTFDPTEE
jgi:hypothetical protein